MRTFTSVPGIRVLLKSPLCDLGVPDGLSVSKGEHCRRVKGEKGSESAPSSPVRTPCEVFRLWLGSRGITFCVYNLEIPQMSKKRVAAPLKLVGRVQHYPWGKVGGDSRIASILGGTTEAKPLAEFWIGDHPKAPALVATGGGQTVSLRDLIERDPEALL